MPARESEGVDAAHLLSDAHRADRARHPRPVRARAAPNPATCSCAAGVVRGVAIRFTGPGSCFSVGHVSGSGPAGRCRRAQTFRPDELAQLRREKRRLPIGREISRRAERRLARYALPWQLVVVPEPPRSQDRPVLRRVVRQQVVERGEYLRGDPAPPT